MDPYDLMDRVQAVMSDAAYEGYPLHPNELHLGPKEYLTMVLHSENERIRMVQNRKSAFQELRYGGMEVKFMPIPGIRLGYLYPANDFSRQPDFVAQSSA